MLGIKYILCFSSEKIQKEPTLEENSSSGVVLLVCSFMKYTPILMDHAIQALH